MVTLVVVGLTFLILVMFMCRLHANNRQLAAGLKEVVGLLREGGSTDKMIMESSMTMKGDVRGNTAAMARNFTLLRSNGTDSGDATVDDAMDEPKQGEDADKGEHLARHPSITFKPKRTSVNV